MAREHKVGLDAPRGRALHDFHSSGFNDVRKTACQSSGVDRRTVWRIDAASCLCRVQVGTSVFGAQQLTVCAGVGHLVALASFLGPVPRQPDPTSLCVAARDFLGRADATDLVDGVVHGSDETHCVIHGRPLGVLLGPDGEASFGPSTVATRCAKAAEIALDDHDAERRVEFAQIVRGPKTTESTSDYCDINLGVAFEAVAPIDGTQLVEPECGGGGVSEEIISVRHRSGNYRTTAGLARKMSAVFRIRRKFDSWPRNH